MNLFACYTADSVWKILYNIPKDEAEKERWITDLPNRNLNVTKSTRICNLHWPANALMKRSFRSKHSVLSSPPTIFSGCLPSQRRQLQLIDRRVQERQISLSDPAKVPDELEDFIKQDTIQNFDELFQHVSTTEQYMPCLLYTSPSPRDLSTSRMPSSA